MKKSKPQINIRVPEDLKQKLHEVAAAKGQSVNSEIVRRLWDSFEVKPGDSDLIGRVTEMVIHQLTMDEVKKRLESHGKEQNAGD